MDILTSLVADLNHPIIFAAFFIMLLFAVLDLISFVTKKHKDYKSLIISVGVLGTFTGIFIGLQEFNSNDIEGSIPPLLDGLKIAFITSIGGMGISITLAFLEKLLGTVSDDDLTILMSMDRKLAGINKITNNTLETNDQLKNFRIEIKDEQNTTRKMTLTHLVKLEEALNITANSINESVTQIKNLRSDVTDENKLMRELISSNLEKVNSSLEKAIETLAKGATEEIIKALETVIQDFNQNLTEQFGDNFKRLNESVDNLITWQQNYKEQIEKNTQLLTSVSESLNESKLTLESISSRNQEVIDVNNKLKETLLTQQEQLTRTGHQIESHDQLIKNLTASFDMLKTTFEEISPKVENLSKGIETSLNKQSETLTQLTQDIQTQLPNSLGKLEDSLATLTKTFADDYSAFLERLRDLNQTRH